MKKLVSILLVLISLFSCASAAKKPEYIDLEPGLYEIGEGKDIPSGKYDIRFNGLDQLVVVMYSTNLAEDGLPDLSAQHSFVFAFQSDTNWWNPGGFLVTLFPGYLATGKSPVRLWIEK